MATKKKVKTAQPTKSQLEQICKRVLDTTNNVYRVAEEVLGRKIDDKIFDQLRSECRIFKCEECGLWLPVDQEDEGMGVGICTPCADAMNEPSDLEE